jgi:hypothetical protein
MKAAMPDSFTRQFQGAPQDLISRAKQTATRYNSSFSGDEKSGSFAGYGVEGNYLIEGQTVTIMVTKKPFFATNQIVQSALDQFFA